MQYESLKEIIMGYSGEEALEIQEISNKGQVNKVFSIAAAHNKYIVRIDPAETTTERFKKEAWCMGQATAQGVPTAKTLKIGLTNGNPFMLLSYIDGMPGTPNLVNSVS